MNIVKLSIDNIYSLIKQYHPSYAKVFSSHECETFIMDENDILKLEELLSKIYSYDEYDLYLNQVRQFDKLDTDYLIARGYITKDNWCPTRFIPDEDRKYISTFYISVKFLPKQ